MQALLLRNLRKMSAVTDDKDGNKMGKYNFDKVIDRRGAFAEKWDIKHGELQLLPHLPKERV